MTKCKCKPTTTDRHQINGVRESTLIQRQLHTTTTTYFNKSTALQHTSTKINKMSVTVGLAAKCPSPHPSIKGAHSVASTSNNDQSKEQLNCNSSSFRRKHRPTENISPDEADDHIANGHHIAVLSDNDDDDNLGDDEETNDTDYEIDNSSDDDDTNLDNYLKITIPSDCRLKQSITPTNSPQSQSIQHSPHHAISVLSSILAKYETSGYIEQHYRKRDEFIWNRQINSERTSPRIMRQTNVSDGGTNVKHSSRRNNCYCCIQQCSSSASSTKGTKKMYHQQSTAATTSSNHYMAANLKSRTLSLPQCSFNDDFDTTKLATMCSDINCRCIHVQSAIKTNKKSSTERSSNQVTNDVQCNCSILKLSTNGSDVLETTC